MIAERVEKIRARHKMADRQAAESPPSDQMELFALYIVK